MIPEIRKASIMNNDIVWDINPFIIAMCNNLSWTTKWEAVRFFETLVLIYKITEFQRQGENNFQ
jgi:hypothetical protein